MGRRDWGGVFWGGRLFVVLPLPHLPTPLSSHLLSFFFLSWRPAPSPSVGWCRAALRAETAGKGRSGRGGEEERNPAALKVARWGSASLGGSVGAAMQRLGLSGPCSSFRSARWAALACARASGQRGEQEASQSEDQGENLVLRSDCGTLAAVCGWQLPKVSLRSS